MQSPPPAERTARPTLVIVDPSEEITRLLEALFQLEGFRVVTGYTGDVNWGTDAFEQFVRVHQPDVVIWDITLPYEETWAFFQTVAASPTGQQCRFVLTTTNVHALVDLVGEVPVRDLIGKPWDLDDLVTAVRRVLASGAPHE